jgi:hypothetical protein
MVTSLLPSPQIPKFFRTLWIGEVGRKILICISHPTLVVDHGEKLYHPQNWRLAFDASRERAPETMKILTPHFQTVVKSLRQMADGKKTFLAANLK